MFPLQYTYITRWWLILSKTSIVNWEVQNYRPRPCDLVTVRAELVEIEAGLYVSKLVVVKAPFRARCFISYRPVDINLNCGHADGYRREELPKKACHSGYPAADLHDSSTKISHNIDRRPLNASTTPLSPVLEGRIAALSQNRLRIILDLIPHKLDIAIN